MLYTVTVTLSIEAEDRTEAYKEYLDQVKLEAFEGDSIEIETEGMTKCDNCGEENQRDALECADCGRRLNFQPTED